MRIGIILVLSIILFGGCKSIESRKILFIGNSLTYYNDMPEMLADMLDESEANLTVESSTYPGFSLRGHLNAIIMKSDDDMIYTRPKKEGETTPTEELLLHNKYDIVILQERSGLMLLPDCINREVTKSVSDLEQLIGQESLIYFYQNYPLNFDYPNVICREVNSMEYCTDSIHSVSQEMNLINEGFQLLKGKKDLIEIGEVFKKIMIDEMDINLFADDVHPSTEGSFLIALKFYSALTGKPCSKLNYNNKLDDNTSNKLKAIVDQMQR